MKKAFVSVFAYAAVVATATAIVSQISSGEPRLIPATVGGLAFGITVTAIQHWQSKRKSEYFDN